MRSLPPTQALQLGFPRPLARRRITQRRLVKVQIVRHGYGQTANSAARYLTLVLIRIGTMTHRRMKRCVIRLMLLPITHNSIY